MNRYFPDVMTEGINYEGPTSNNPLAFRWYNPDQEVAGKPMREHLRFAVAYWHSFCGRGADPFGGDIWQRPWDAAGDPMQRARDTMDACFEFVRKLGVEFYCFHDRDIAPEGETHMQSTKNFRSMVDYAEKLQADTGIKLLWGTAKLFGHPRYTHGAATSPDAHVFAMAADQVRNCLEATHRLGGENYVFWGGREGYETLLNTDLKRERENLARFLHLAVDWKKKIGFEGQFLIEPKPCEPTKHQYDRDAATCLGFLREFDLLDHFKLNIEANHATLAGHEFQHELEVAAAAGKLGSVDANMGDLLLGWDTDQFPTNLYDTTRAMMSILQSGGLAPGGLNFDAKLRRGSLELNDLFHGHIAGMDTWARGLVLADKVISDGVLQKEKDDRYWSWTESLGKTIYDEKTDLETMSNIVNDGGEPLPRSGGQERLENVLNRYIFGDRG